MKKCFLIVQYFVIKCYFYVNYVTDWSSGRTLFSLDPIPRETALD